MSRRQEGARTAGIAQKLCAAAYVVCLFGCTFDETGYSYSASDGRAGPDAFYGGDAWAGDGSTVPDAAPQLDGNPSCTGDDFECLPDGTASVCNGGAWVDLGDCPLGCDAVARQCRVPSNVPAGWMSNGTGDAAFGVIASPVTIDTDTGEIHTSGAQVLRPAMMGLHTGSGIWYGQLEQGAGGPGLGVFAMDDLNIAAGATLVAEGDRALVILVADNAAIQGTILVAADARAAGPGGFAGGDSGQDAAGPCAGRIGYGEQVDEGGCTSGSGGGGHGGIGGNGGDTTCGGTWSGGDGGNTCGTPELIPLAGGSGGAGGTAMSDGDDTNPGHGGGGGGAVQISAGGTIAIWTAGRVSAGGGGGGECTGAGGAGGGAGGAVLFEAPSVQLHIGSVVAANGGGGGGGDCT